MAESQQKTQFLSQTYTRRNHVPSVDLGAFDITVDPEQGRVEILVRVYLDTKPTSQLQLSKFENRFKELVPEVWNNQARFQCTKKGWDDISLALHVKIETTGITNAHFHIQVQDEDLAQHAQGPYAMVTEKVTEKLPKAYVEEKKFAPRAGEFGAAAINEGEIGSYRTNIIYDLSKIPLTVPIKASVAQDAVARQRLEKFAREIMALKIPRKFRSARRPTLTVNGCGGGDRVNPSSTKLAWKGLSL